MGKQKEQMTQKEIVQKLLATMPQVLLPLVQAITQPKSTIAKKQETKKASTWDASHKTVAGKNMGGRLSGHGMNLDAETYQKALEAQREDERRTAAGAKAVGYKWVGTIPALFETAGQTIDNTLDDLDNDSLKAVRAQQKDLWNTGAYKGRLNAETGAASEEMQRINELDIEANAVKTKTPVDQSQFGQQMMAQSRKHQAEATEGLSGFEKLLADATIDFFGNVPTVAVSAISPAAGAAVGGLMTAGEKSSELNARGVNPAESLVRGAISGGIGVISDGIPVQKLPMGKIVKLITNGGGEPFVMKKLQEAGVDATKDAVNYVMNYLADLAAGDPNAEWTWGELLQSAAFSALNGRIYDAAGSAIKQNLPKASRKGVR